MSIVGQFFDTCFFSWFLFSVKELGLLTNPGYWVRVLEVLAPICIFYCKQCMM
jgi:hypothetical protein